MSTDQEVAILFADVVGSTQLYELLGDEQARQTVQQCLEEMKQATERCGGHVIKTMGDEIMATFTTADDAIDAATQMQQRITNSTTIGGDETQVAIRIGCHFGPVVVADRDIFGAAVHTANRMTSQAKSGQIMTTATTVEQLSAEWIQLARQIDVATVKGRSDEVALFEILWQPEEATSMLPSISWAERKEVGPGALRLRYQGEEIVLGPNGRTAVRLGRADDNDVVIKGNLISRIHARIEIARNRFVLVDESTNGTFIQRDDGEEIYIRRDSAQLTGSGVLGLGRVAARGTQLAVEYVCESE